MRTARVRSSLWICAALAVAAACTGTAQVYAPEGARVTASGALAAQIRIPREEPHGEVRVQSMGIARLTTGDRRELPALQIRLTVGNDSDDTPWVVDTRQQLLEIRGEGRSAPLFVNSDRDSLPVVRIGRREQRVFDLYFPLPATVNDAGDLEVFELLWQVRTAGRTVAERSAFGRLDVDPVYVPTLHAGWGPYWWFDPGHAATYVHSRPIRVRHPSQIRIARPPRGPYGARPDRG